MCEVSGVGPRVSVVMAVRDAANTVAAAMDSVLGQTFGDFEFVVVDDGSRDGSVEIAQEFAAGDLRVCVVGREREGLVESLVYGTGLARGEYVARMDGDDVAMPTRFERQASLLDSDPKLAVVSSLVEIVSDGGLGSGIRRYERWVNGLCSHDDICRELFVESPLAHPSVMMRAEAMRVVGGYRVQPEWPEDYDLWMRMWRAKLVRKPWGGIRGRVRLHTQGADDATGLLDLDQWYSMVSESEWKETLSPRPPRVTAPPLDCGPAGCCRVPRTV